MAITAKPEVLSPRTKRGGKAFDDEHLDLLSHLLDDFIRVPGTPIRFGLDGIVGFIPGVGDVLGGLASSIIIVAAWVRGVPRVTVARMVLNVAIETAVGSVPFLGNLFDIGWKANRRNYKLLRGSIDAPERHTGMSWLFIAGVCVVLAALMFVPLVLIGWGLHTIGMDLHKLSGR
ncbi:DUF4112 domain-containing protein [Granulicella tundricola]|uniref:DUF4112 domain-containing protein n=1 Tax=Granulicella tundricola (strain ATCC BAA-1859 / DSM 23138 / MP5ACTX9) TaxID=1198114 RepID=E8WY11_GRATM|nr:DUF4112 domain-containing protein [Granulicella tundricola]ADW67550.1 hypothetical protein AciX9_0478 [Granulicella tundricola MP5ACTX9]